MPAVLDLAALQQWLARQPEIATAWLFGSRARGDHRPDSDVDIAILTFDERGASAKGRLGWLVDCASALRLPIDAVDVIDLRRAPPLLVVAALHEGRTLVDKNDDLRASFCVEAVHRAEEARHLRSIAMAVRRERWLGAPRGGT